MKKVKLAYWFICFAPNVLLAQFALNATGNTLKSDSVSYAYSVGEVTGFQLNENCLFTPGVIQPAINIYFRPVTNGFGPLHQILIYPNPTYDMITIETSYPDLSTYQITNSEGKTVETGKYKYSPLHIGHLPAGIYLMTLFSTDYKTKQSFKIILQ